MGRTGASQLGKPPKPGTTPRNYGAHDEQVVAIVRGLTLGYAPTIWLPSGFNAVTRPSQGISPKRTSPVHRAEGFWRNVIPVPMSGSKFRAFDNRPVSCRTAKRCLTPFQGDEICLAPIKPALPWTTFQLKHVGWIDPHSSRRSSQSWTFSKRHWKCGVLHLDVIPSTISEYACPSLRRAEFG